MNLLTRWWQRRLRARERAAADDAARASQAASQVPPLPWSTYTSEPHGHSANTDIDDANRHRLWRWFEDSHDPAPDRQPDSGSSGGSGGL